METTASSTTLVPSIFHLAPALKCQCGDLCGAQVIAEEFCPCKLLLSRPFLQLLQPHQLAQFPLSRRPIKHQRTADQPPIVRIVHVEDFRPQD